MCQPSRCFPKGGRHETVCKQGRWVLKGVDLVVVPHRLEKGMSVRRTLGPEGGMDCDVPHWLGGEQITFYKRVETFP